MAEIQINSAERKIILEILASHIPKETEVWAFGSRAKGTSHRGSDLDLALIGSEFVSYSIIGRLAVEFSESDLPYKVDVVDFQRVPEWLREIITRDRIPLPLTSQ